MPNTEQYGSGTVPRKSDTVRMLIVKELAGGPQVYAGAGSPAGVVTAPPGSLYLNTSGGANTTLYVKESGTGSSGWVAK